jgi:26S proteasome regulatory subunit N1
VESAFASDLDKSHILVFVLDPGCHFQDKLVTGGGVEDGAEASGDPDKSHWIFKNKDWAKVSATASIGMVMLWDVDAGLPLIDKYLYSADKQVVAGELVPF